MNLNQIKQEIRAIELLAEYQPIIDDILNTTENGILLSDSERENWIGSHALMFWTSAYVLVEDFVSGKKTLRDNALGMQDDALGQFVSKKYGTTKVIMACTYHEILRKINTERKSTNDVMPALYTIGNPAIFAERRKDLPLGTYFEYAWPDYFVDQAKGDDTLIFGVDGMLVQSLPFANCQYNYVSTGMGSNDENQTPILPKSELTRILTRTQPTTKFKLVKEALPNIMPCVYSRKDISDDIQTDAIIQNMPDSPGSFLHRIDIKTPATLPVATPVIFENADARFAVPAGPLFMALSDTFGNGADEFEVRVFEVDDMILLDTSEIVSEESEFTYQDPETGEMKTQVGTTIRVVTFNTLVIKGFNQYPSYYLNYNEQDPFAEQPSAKEIAAKNVEVLTLPNSILARQMRVMVNGKKKPLSLASLDKWKESTLSYADAIRIATEHIDEFTKVDEAGVRVNSGQVYEQTKNAAEEYFKDKNGKISQADAFVLAQGLSKYVYTIEETFFNLNPNFSDPEKLLGYFLGQGVKPNLLFKNQISPYRILCARLLGIDYALNYEELCKQSARNGHLFIDRVEKDEPKYLNAEHFLSGNIYVRKIQVTSEKFVDELKDIFPENWSDVLEHHQNLVEQYSPKFMRLRHGTQDEYKNLIRLNGFDKPYGTKKSDRLQEVTRITLAQGLFPARGEDGSGIPSADIAKEIFKNEDSPYIAGTALTRYINREVDGSIYVLNGRQLFQQYASQEGRNAASLASSKLRYNNIGKQDAFDYFFEMPTGQASGYWHILENGLTIANDELEPQETRITEEIYFRNRDPKARDFEGQMPPMAQFKKEQFNLKWFLKNWDKLGEESVLSGMSTKDKLERLGYDVDDKKVVKQLFEVIQDKLFAVYHQMKSATIYEGENLMSVASAVAMGKKYNANVNLLFNMKYNNFAVPPKDRIPIFLENMRHFGDLGNFTPDMLNSEGKPAGFSLRQAQKDGLRFLGTNGNSGLLAHEVGFGKTTSSIAKVSDLFLRGEAKRVLVAVPNPVYDGGNWEREIQGAKNDDGSRRVNGLLPSYVTLVKLGGLNFSDLRGKKINPAHPDWAQKSEGTEYDGPMAYTNSDLELIKVMKEAAPELIALVGGDFNKYKDNKGILTAREQKYGLDKQRGAWISPQSFFKEDKNPLPQEIVRLPLQKQTLAGVTTFKVPADQFWHTDNQPYLEFGNIADIENDSVDNQESFIKSVVSILKSKAPDLDVSGDKGGDLELLLGKLYSILDKYNSRYNEIESVFPDTLGALKEPTGSQITNSLKRLKADFTKGSVTPTRWIAMGLYETLNGAEKRNFWPFTGTKSFYERVVVPHIKGLDEKNKFGSVQEIEERLIKDFPWLKQAPAFVTNINFQVPEVPEMRAMARMQLKTALELQLTEELSYFFKILPKQAPYFVGKFKEWTKRDNTILLCKHSAIKNLSVEQRYAMDSVLFMAGVYRGSDSQFVNTKLPEKFFDDKSPMTKRVARVESNTLDAESQILNAQEKKKLFLSQYRGLPLALLNTQAFIVDEVHNFNRLFNRVKVGTKVKERVHGRRMRNTNTLALKYAEKPGAGEYNAHVTGRPSPPDMRKDFNTKSNYSLKGEVQNFLAICLYYQNIAGAISGRGKRKLANTIFLSATPFTDDNFQMVSLFGGLSREKMLQANVFNTFDFFQLYVRELWVKDIDYQNNYSLFAKIVGYKNIYSLSQMIKSFTDFKVSDEEINKNRPIKALIGTTKAKNLPKDPALDKLRALVPFSEAQKKMNADMEAYITLQSNNPIAVTTEKLKEAKDIYRKLQKRAGTFGPADEIVEQLEELVEVNSNGEIFVSIENTADAVGLVEEIQELDPENKYAKQVQDYLFSTEEAAGGDEEDEEVEDAGEADTSRNVGGNISTESSSDSEAKIIAQRALQASKKALNTLVSPYYEVMNGDKNLMNPYLPPLDGTDSENAQRFVENSPKILYACQAIAKMLKHAVDKGQVYADAGPNAIMGQVTFCGLYQVKYHGQVYYIFDMMKQYIIDQNRDLLLNLPNYRDGEEGIDRMFGIIDARAGEDEKAAIVDDFNSGHCLFLFGTTIIREGINLQQNCPIMYILSMAFVPMVYMQLHGRVWRQKNPYKYAFLVNVLTINSVDAFVYSKLEQKIDSVREMLGSEVYDSEETQFDVDLKEIKINLISDPEKLAEMEWQEAQDELAKEKYQLEQNITLLPRVESNYEEAIARYGMATRMIREVSETYIRLMSVYSGNIYAERKHAQDVNADVLSKFRKAYDKQFPDEKTRNAFEVNPDAKRFQDKTGKTIYRTIEQVKSDIRKKSMTSVPKLTLQEGIKAVLKANEAGEVLLNNDALRFGINTPFDLNERSSRNAWTQATDALHKINEKVESDLKALKSRSYQDWEDYNKQRGVLLYATADSDEEILDKFGVYKGQGHFKVAKAMCFKVAYMANRDMNLAYQDSSDIKNLQENFLTGPDAITIGLYNDIVAGQMIGKRRATLADIPNLIEKSQKRFDQISDDLNNESRWLAEKAKEYRKMLEERDGKKKPSVESRVKQLEALFPYLEKRK